MIEVLKNKNQTTKFQILVEIADKGPDIQQREIAREMEITPQAVSDYIAQLIAVAGDRQSHRGAFVATNLLNCLINCQSSR